MCSVKWTRVDDSEGANFELPAKASMRLIKDTLGITNRRIRIESQFGQWTRYRLIGTVYTFTVTEC